jgi:hypothetical protein
MFNSTFFKFFITFVLIIGASFLIMGIAGGFNQQNSADKTTQPIILR